MKCVVLATLALSALVQAEVVPLPVFLREVAARQDGNMNDYFDSLVVQLQAMVIREGLDPMALPDHINDISFKDLLGITWHGELELTTGWLQNLAQLVRAGDATLSYSHKLMYITVEIGFPDLVLNYDFKAQIMNIGPKGQITGDIKDLRLQVEIMVDVETFDINLQQLEITNAGKIDVKVNSSGLLDLLADAIADVVTGIFHNVIVKVIETQVRDVVQNAIDNINVGGSNSTASF